MSVHIDGVCDKCGGRVMVEGEVFCWFCRHPEQAAKARVARENNRESLREDN